MEKAKFTFYDIKEFGYYKHGSDDSVFGDLHRILRDLQHWAAEKELGQTKTYQVGGLLPTYFLDALRSRDTWLLCLWNESPSTDGAVASISAHAPVGTNSVTMNELEEGHIPGTASYFWVLPDAGLVAAIRFQHRSTARQQMCKYLREFMRSFSSYAVVEEEGEITVQGYRDTARSEIVRARPRFTIDIHRQEAEYQYLLNSAHRVRRVFKTDTLDLSQREDRAFWQKLLDAAHLTEPSNRPHEVRMNFDIQVEGGLTRDDMAKVIDTWNEEEEESDYGFKLSQETQTRWLGKTVAKDSLMLDVPRLNPEMVDPRFLLRELERHRPQLLEMVR